MPLRRVRHAAEVHVDRDAPLSVGRAAPHRPRAARVRGDPGAAGSRRVGRGKDWIGIWGRRDEAVSAPASSPPLAGERQRGGAACACICCFPLPALQPKLDLSDFGPLLMPKSGKPDFGRTRGRERELSARKAEVNKPNPTGSFFVPHDIEAPIAGSASGPLAGFTAVVKDLYDIAGMRTGGGSPEWLAAQQPARTHAAAVEKILAAGATITGKTICDEFFYSGSGISSHYGTPVNVRAPGRIPGGSSSGSAAATAANACDFALGSDTGGSVRMPASFCGIYGLRPTHGRIDLAGAIAMA